MNSDENASNQNARSQEPTQTIVASWDEDFPSLTNSGSYTTLRPKFVQKSSRGFAINDRNFPALGSETNIRMNVTNSVDCHPSSSTPVTSTNISVQVNRKKPKVTNKSGPQPNDTPSSSTLSLTWVKKAKGKKPPPEPPVPVEAPVKPPTLNGRNFPTLHKNNVGNETAVCESAKKNKKSTLSVHIDENDNQRMKVNYSKAIAVAAAKSSSSEAKTNNKKPGSSKAKEKTESSSQSSNKDSKTPCFLLNANRKKVKMKPETFTTLNDPANSQSLLPQPSTENYSKERKADSETNKLQNAIVKSNNVNCDKSNTDEKIKNSDKKSQVKEKRENAQRKDVEKRDAQQKNKENEPRPTKSDRVEKEKKNLSKSETRASNVLKSSDNSERKTEKTGTSEKKTDQKSQRLKKSELKIAPMSEPDIQVDSSKNSASTSVTNKPPPGLGKPTVTSAPPGFVPLQNGFSSHSLNKTSIPSLNSSVSDTISVYQQPVDFVSRNSQLIEKINNSLVNQNEDALNEFKNTSLLFREGYISATDYYLYCLENIKSEKFIDVFVDLVALLPNILKQQVRFLIFSCLTFFISYFL